MVGERAEETEVERVERWRLHVLIEAGFAVEDAERLAASPADLHRAVDLVAGGCPHRLAAAILL